MQHVASKPTVPNISHQAVGQRERPAEAGASASPFAMLLDETGAAPPPTRNNQCARTQTNASSSCRETRPSQRTDTERTPDTSDTDAAAVEPEASDGEPSVGTSAQTETDHSDEGDPAIDAALSLDGVLAAVIDPATPPQPPTAVVVPAPADVPSPVAADAPVDIEAPAVTAAAAPTPVPPSVPDITESPTPPAGEAAPSAPPTAADAAAPETPDAPAFTATNTPTAPDAGTTDKPAVAEPGTSATSDVALASVPNDGDAPLETPQGSDAPQTPVAQRQPSHQTAPVTRSRPAPANETEPTTTLAPSTETAPSSSSRLDQAKLDAIAQPEDAQATGSESPEPPAPDIAERPQPGRSLSDFVQANKPADNPANLQVGRDFGQSVAATAHTLHAADTASPAGQSSPAGMLASAPVPVPIDSLAVTIAARAQAGNTRFEIRLDPPELGRIDVRLDIDRSGQVTSRLVVERAETLDVLRRDAHQLERALQDAGLKTSDNSLQFSLRDQSFAERHDRSDLDREQTPIADPELPVVESAVVAYGMTLRGGSGVDIRV